MDQNTTPKGNEWDSDEKAIGDLTCDNASRFLAGFTAAFRAFAAGRTPADQVTILKNILAHQAALLAAVSGEDKQDVEKSTGLMMASLGMAMVVVNAPVQASALIKLSENGIRAMTELSKNHDLTTHHIDFHVRKGKEDGDVEIACKAVPVEEMEKKIAASSVGKALKLINDQDNRKE